MTASELAGRIEKSRRSGSDQWSGRCPAHDDRKASLSWADGDLALVVTCHAGCTVDDIAAALSLSRSELLNGGAGLASSIVAEYDYRDEAGALLYQVVRFTGKQFRARHPDGSGGWTWSLEGVRRVPYRLPEVVATVRDGGTVYVVEGEKDADSINALPDAGNLIATTNPGGAGKWRPEYTRVLSGARVLVVADCDEPGRKHARQVADSIRATAASVRILEPAAGKDVTEHLAAGLGLSDLVGQAKPLSFETLETVLCRPMPQTPWAVEGLLCLGDVAILAGAGGVGKSWIALYVGLCLAAGKPLWDYLKCVRPYRVATIDLESRPWEIDQRLYRLANGMDANALDYAGRLNVVRDRIRLDKPEDVDRLTESLRLWRTEVLIVDSMRRTFSGDENSSSAISDLFLSALDPIRNELGCAIILLDHVRKRTGEKELDSPDQALRGSTDKYNMSDLVIGAERRDGRIGIHPSKGRHRGAPLQPFLVEFSGFAADDPEDSPVSARYVGPVDTASDAIQDAILVLLNAAGDAGMLRGEIIGRSGYSQAHVRNGLGALVARRRVRRSREGRQTRYWISGESPSQLPCDQ